MTVSPRMETKTNHEQGLVRPRFCKRQVQNVLHGIKEKRSLKVQLPLLFMWHQGAFDIDQGASVWVAL